MGAPEESLIKGRSNAKAQIKEANKVWGKAFQVEQLQKSRDHPCARTDKARTLNPERAVAEAIALGTLVEKATTSQQPGKEGMQAVIPCLLSLSSSPMASC